VLKAKTRSSGEEIPRRAEMVEGRAMLVEVQGIEAPEMRGAYSRDVEQYLDFCNRTRSALAEGLAAWRDDCVRWG
jgi:hypothetical protein